MERAFLSASSSTDGECRTACWVGSICRAERNATNPTHPAPPSEVIRWNCIESLLQSVLHPGWYASDGGCRTSSRTDATTHDTHQSVDVRQHKDAAKCCLAAYCQPQNRKHHHFWLLSCLSNWEAFGRFLPSLQPLRAHSARAHLSVYSLPEFHPFPLSFFLLSPFKTPGVGWRAARAYGLPSNCPPMVSVGPSSPRFSAWSVGVLRHWCNTPLLGALLFACDAVGARGPPARSSSAGWQIRRNNIFFIP